jgi:hypothetical protein
VLVVMYASMESIDNVQCMENIYICVYVCIYRLCLDLSLLPVVTSKVCNEYWRQELPCHDADAAYDE